MSYYFDDSDTECHCGCGFNSPSPILMEKLDRLQEAVGIDTPLEITCVCRCDEHNYAVGGVMGSQHTLGTAADIAVPEGWTVDEFADLAVRLRFDGIGRYYSDDFIHVDVRSGGHEAACYQWTDDD